MAISSKRPLITVIRDPSPTPHPYEPVDLRQYPSALSEGELVRRRSGLYSYIQENPLILVALSAGILTTVLLFWFSLWLASQTAWTCAGFYNCQVPSQVIWVRDHIGIVQGLFTLLYLAGLSAITWVACCLFEAGLWAVLSIQPLNIAQIDAYLAVSQRSLLATPSLIYAIRSIPAAALLSIVLIAILTPIAGAPLVGYIFDPSNNTLRVQSTWTPGGGISPIFAQQNPPIMVSDGAVSLFTAYSRKLSPEPLPEYRDWYINREMLATRGNMTVRAVRMQKNVSCESILLLQNIIPNNGTGVLEFATRMASQNQRGQQAQNSDHVLVRTLPALTVWADSFTFIHINRTSASLIFASLNGSIEGVETSPIYHDPYIKSASALRCNVDIEFIDDVLRIGDGGLPAPVVTLSSNEGIHIGHCNSSSAAHGCDNPNSGTSMSAMPAEPNTLNEVILHFAMAPILVGVSVNGTQPQFEAQGDTDLLPRVFTSTDTSTNNTWSQAEIKALIETSIGCLAISSSTDFESDHSPVTLTSTIFTNKLAMNRTPLLFIPTGALLICVMSLLALNIHLHNKYNLPVMRGASLREILRSMHTQYMYGLIDPNSRNWHRGGTLGEVAVMFGAIDGITGEVQVGLGNPSDVHRFGKGYGRRMMDTALRSWTSPPQRPEDSSTMLVRPVEQAEWPLNTAEERIERREWPLVSPRSMS